MTPFQKKLTGLQDEFLEHMQGVSLAKNVGSRFKQVLCLDRLHITV
jgi:hypothetical protein